MIHLPVLSALLHCNVWDSTAVRFIRLITLADQERKNHSTKTVMPLVFSAPCNTVTPTLRTMRLKKIKTNEVICFIAYLLPLCILMYQLIKKNPKDNYLGFLSSSYSVRQSTKYIHCQFCKKNNKDVLLPIVQVN
jgi:hypothetical protein